MIDDSTQKALVIEAIRALSITNSNFFDTKTIKTLYHYTTIEALFNGILVKNPEIEERAISLFASDYRYLNDDKEVKQGCKMLKEINKEYFKLDSPKFYFDKDQSAYIISFSKEKDSIPMWSTYGNKGDGIALGFDSAILSETLCPIVPCLYSKQETIKFLSYALTESDRFNKVNSKEDVTMEYVEKNLYRLAFINFHMISQIKNEYYKYEKEFRYICHYSDGKEFRYHNNLIIPYIKEYLPKKALKTIVIGPNLNHQRVALSIREYIDNLGFNDVKIVLSKAPFKNL